MRNLFTFVAAAFAGNTLINEAEAVKILMAGDFDVDHRAFFESTARAIADNTDFPNEVYFMTTELEATKVEKVSDRLYKYGVGTNHSFELKCKETEPENYLRLDKQTAEMYFNNQVMLNDLKNQEFELGIGGLNMADSLLYRYLGVNYIKLTEEDVESYTMQRKLKMPVLTSTDPSSQVWARFDYSTLPNFGELSYRLPFFGLY